MLNRTGIIGLFSLLLLVACRSGIETTLTTNESITIKGLRVPNSVQAGQRYEVSITGIKRATPAIDPKEACFTWETPYRNLEGPFCIPIKFSEMTDKITLSLITRNPNTYTLWVYLTYQDGKKMRKSNAVSTYLRVSN